VNQAATGEGGEAYGSHHLGSNLEHSKLQNCGRPSVERILIIEHDVALRKILQRLFSSEGYAVEVVPDAVCGLERLRKEHQPL
jgi:hypothetical protein